MKEYYLLTNRHINMFGKNWLLFWGPNNQGYCSSTKNAGVYKNDEVKAYPIITSRIEYRELKVKPDDYYMPVEVIKNEYEEVTLVEI